MIDFDPGHDPGPVPSPCISVCRMHPGSGLCEGCLRTIDEISRWSTATDETKRAVWAEINRRRQDLFC